MASCGGIGETIQLPKTISCTFCALMYDGSLTAFVSRWSSLVSFVQ